MIKALAKLTFVDTVLQAYKTHSLECYVFILILIVTSEVLISLLSFLKYSIYLKTDLNGGE